MGIVARASVCASVIARRFTRVVRASVRACARLRAHWLQWRASSWVILLLLFMAALVFPLEEFGAARARTMGAGAIIVCCCCGHQQAAQLHSWRRYWPLAADCRLPREKEKEIETERETHKETDARAPRWPKAIRESVRRAARQRNQFVSRRVARARALAIGCRAGTGTGAAAAAGKRPCRWWAQLNRRLFH